MQNPFRVMMAAVLLTGALNILAADREVLQLAVPAQPIAAAINELSRQSGLRIVINSRTAKGIVSNKVEGTLTAEAALTKLLENTGLEYEYLGENAVEVVKKGRPIATTSKDSQAGSPEGMQLARTDGASATSQGQDEKAVASSAASGAQDLQEIVVTAQKREERLQDVPVPVTALDGASLATNNQLRLADYYSKVPALSLTTGQPFGSSTVSIRGIITGINQSPTVGVVVDDVPYTSSNVRGFGHVVAEFDPGDLQRIEVLRGPQGTLYGASSIGGLLKYVTVEPSTERVSGRMQVGANGVRNGDELGYNISGAINFPISETVAIRASAFNRFDPGYVNDPVRGAQGVNSAEVTGGRATLLWRPSQDFSMKLSALIQDSDADGNAHVDLLPGFGDLEQSTPPGSEGYRKNLQVFSANVNAKAGIFDITSVSAYISNENIFSWDFSKRFGTLANNTFPGNTAATSAQEINTTKFTQELRFAAPIGSKVDWRFGGFYNHEDTPDNDQRVLAANFATGAIVGQLAFLDVVDKFEEYAVFTDFTLKFTDRFDLQLGARASENREELLQTNSGVLFGGTFPEPLAKSKDSSVTYLVTPRFRLTPDLMVYARLASGYRPGGPNVGATISSVTPREYGPDKTRNYEIGVKADLMNRLLSVDASVYHIDWQDIQLTLRDVLTYIANAGEAKSEGVELSLQLRPVAGMTLAAWGAWNTAELTESFPPTTVGAIGAKGDRLPFSSRFSGNLSIDQEFPLGSVATAFIGSSISYIGDRKSVFVATPTRATFPSYTKIDVRAGMRYDTWSVNLFANNVADKRGILSDAFYPGAVTYIQPRSYGLAVARDF